MTSKAMETRRNTVSARVSPETYSKFEIVCKILKIDRSSFIKSCVEKLVTDNQFLLDTFDQTDMLIRYVKETLSKLPSDLVVVKNGSWDKVHESTIIVACDGLWSTSEKVWSIGMELCKKYRLDLVEEETSRSFAGEDMFDLADLGLLALPSEKTTDATDLIEPYESSLWTDQLELKKNVLLISAVEAIKKHSALKILEEAFEYVASKCSERLPPKSHVLEIDASGKFTRSGDSLVVPASIVHKAGKGG